MRIAGKVFIVTGGATGLGASTARMLAAHGGKVVIADMQTDEGKTVARHINGVFIECDVRQKANGQTVIAAAGELGKLMGLINCAGIEPLEQTVDTNTPHSLASFSETVTLSMVGRYIMIRLAAEAMARNEPETTGERGILISTTSITIPTETYNAVKNGSIDILQLPFACDLARQGIRHITVVPCVLAPPMSLDRPQELPEQPPPPDASSIFMQKLHPPAAYTKLIRKIIENDMLKNDVIWLDDEAAG